MTMSLISTYPKGEKMEDLFIKVAKLGEKVKEFFLEEGKTVQDVLELAGFRTRGFDLRINGNPAKLTDVLADGDIVTLIPKIKGGGC